MTDREELLTLLRRLRTERGPAVVKLHHEEPAAVPEDMKKYVVGTSFSVEFTRAKERGIVFLFDNDGRLTSIDLYDSRPPEEPLRLASATRPVIGAPALARSPMRADNEDMNELFEHVAEVADSGTELSPEYIANQLVVRGERLASLRGKRLTPGMIRLVANAHAEQAQGVVAELERIAAEREGH